MTLSERVLKSHWEENNQKCPICPHAPSKHETDYRHIDEHGDEVMSVVCKVKGCGCDDYEE